MTNKLTVNKIKKEKNKIEYEYSIEGEWSKYFDTCEKFYVTYDIDISKIDDSIAIVPLLGNFLMIASAFNAKIYVEKLDKDFYDCLNKIIDAYSKMYDNVKFKKNVVIANNLISNKNNSKEKRNILFFSGGVDAYTSLISHAEEKLMLVTILGSDIEDTNKKGWKEAIDTNNKVAKKYNQPITTLTSNFRKVINNEELNKWSYEHVNDNWWHALQHSFAMTSLAAPISKEYNSEKLYYAATYNSKQNLNVKCASDPSVDNNIKFNGCNVIHDGYDFTRFDKIKFICNYMTQNKKITKLRVCYRTDTGDNCCVCRKCLMTIMMILLTGNDPKKFGFNYDKKNFQKQFAVSIKELEYENPYMYDLYEYSFSEVQEEIKKQFKKEEIAKELMPFYLLTSEQFKYYVMSPSSINESNRKKIDWLTDSYNWWHQHSLDQDKHISDLEGKIKWLESQLNEVKK